MKSITIKGSKRESVGKVSTKALRNAGMVPCVIYGGENPIHFSAEEKAFKKLVYTPNVYKEITLNIPVKLTGTSPGVLNGGSLRFTNRKLRVKALPANLPDFISADISPLKIGNKLFVTSLFNDDYTFMHPENTVVVQVRTSRNATVAVDEEEAAE